MTKVVVLRNMLGNREQGWALFNGKEVVEMTSKDIRQAIEAGEDIKGLVIEGDELVADENGFYVTNIMEHRQVNSYKPMIANEHVISNVFYIILKRNGNRYDAISTRWERVTFSEDKVKTYLELGIISAGAKLVNDKVVLAGDKAEFTKPEKIAEKADLAKPNKVVEVNKK